MKLTHKQLNKYYGSMEDHQFRHFNHALGMMIYSKEQYINELDKKGLIPYEMAEQMAEEYDRKNPRKEYGLSVKASDIIRSLKLTADKHGNLKLGSRAIRALREIGAIPDEEKQKLILEASRNYSHS